MSFEGYDEYLCEDGHYRAADVYDYGFHRIICSCGKKFVWYNLVDQTNDEGVSAELEVLQEEKLEECPTCGHKKVIKETKYKIPTNCGKAYDSEKEEGYGWEEV